MLLVSFRILEKYILESCPIDHTYLEMIVLIIVMTIEY